MNNEMGEADRQEQALAGAEACIKPVSGLPAVRDPIAHCFY